MQSVTKSQVPSLTLWSARQVAEFCGVKVRTIYAWVSQGKLRVGIEVYRPPGVLKLRFDAGKVQEWLQTTQEGR